MIKLEDVAKVYSGRPGGACGLLGKAYQSGPMIKKVVKMVNESKPSDVYTGFDGEFVWIDLKDESGDLKRTYTVYFKKRAS